MSKKNKNQNRQQNQEEFKAAARKKAEAAAAETTKTKKDIKPVPKTHDDKGQLLKLKRADFPYNRPGIIAYCDYRIEYWQIKKQDMLKKADPAKKLQTQREKLAAKLKALDEKIAAESTTPTKEV